MQISFTLTTTKNLSSNRQLCSSSAFTCALFNADLLSFSCQKLADQALKLKDEVDILRDAAEKAAKFEAAVDSYKKKLEDMADLRRQVS